MRIVELKIHNFRGVREGQIIFDKHTALIGANNSGKSTVIEALALLFGRDRLVKSLTEHDFFGTDPTAADRIRLIATIIGFVDEDSARYPAWFGPEAGIEKWYDPVSNDVSAEKSANHTMLCAQIAFVARFDNETLEVETIRYFLDDDGLDDPFLEESVKRVPVSVLAEFGFYLIGVSRTWDKMISFGSELFRRVLTSVGAIPSAVVRAERDRIRNPSPPLESQGALCDLVTRVDTELSQFFCNGPVNHQPKLTLLF